jgi:alpha-beta hydrolase superfamily lysophospholipase
MKACREIRYPGAGHDLHMESDRVRSAWLREISAFAAPPATAKTPAGKDHRHGL